MDINWEKEYSSMIESALQLHTKYVELKLRFENLQNYNRQLQKEIEELKELMKYQ